VYEDFYHLQAKPFRLSPDRRFFFASRGHKQALAYLRYGLSQDEGFVVITGAPGTGKTTLAQVLLKEMSQSNVVVAHLTTTQLNADETLCMIAAAFGLSYEGLDKPGLLKSLEGFLLAQTRAHKRVLLVVDEAQNLPPRSIEELRMLSNLQVDNKALLQTFLLGQAQFHQMLKRPDLEQFRQRVIASYNLGELAEDECQRYIESRLQNVGWQDDPHFTAVAHKEIYQYTRGIPRRINLLCDRLMLIGFLEEVHEIDEVLLRKVTDELKHEISGNPEENDELTYDHDSLYAELHHPSEQVGTSDPLEKSESASKAKWANKKKVHSDSKISDDSVLEELETQDKHSAYSMNQNNNPESFFNPDLDDNSLDKVMPEDDFDKLVAQEQMDENAKEDNDRSENKVRGSSSHAQHTNKDRFHVIDGGRNEWRADKDEIYGNATISENDGSSGVFSPTADEPNDANVVLRKILRLVLAYHRSPKSFPGLEDPTQPLPSGMTQILSLAVSEDDVLKNLRQIAVMGISPAMLRGAVRFFIHHVMFISGGSDFRVLGLAPNSSLELAKEHFDLLMQIMRQEKQINEGDDGAIAQIRESYERLRQDEIARETSDENSDDDLDFDLSPDRGGSRLGKVNFEAERDQRLSQDIEDDLDIDLSPKGSVSNLTIPGSEGDVDQLSDIITNDQQTAQTSRNIILVSGTVVIVFVLYLTQIVSVKGPVVDTDISSSVGTQQALEPIKMDENVSTTDSPTTDVTTEKIDAVAGIDRELDETTVKNGEDSASIARRQRVLAELRAETEAKEKARIAAEAIGRTRQKAEAKQAALARQEEAKAKVDAEVKAKAKVDAEVKAKAKVDAEVKAKAKVDAEAKARQEAEVRARAEAAKQAQAELEFRTALKASQESERARAKTKEAVKASAKRASTIVSEVSDSQGGGVTNTQNVNTRTTVDEVVPVKAEAPVEVAKKVVDKPGQLASIGELKQVLENFSGAYRAGDIEQFMALFTADAKTNDRLTVQGIRDDYAGLFAGTEYRKIDFSAMQWQREGGVSRGEGAYVVKVRPNGKGKIDVYRGKLRFNIGRYGERLLINYFSFK